MQPTARYRDLPQIFLDGFDKRQNSGLAIQELCVRTPQGIRHLGILRYPWASYLTQNRPHAAYKRVLIMSCLQNRHRMHVNASHSSVCINAGSLVVPSAEDGYRQTVISVCLFQRLGICAMCTQLSTFELQHFNSVILYS